MRRRRAPRGEEEEEEDDMTTAWRWSGGGVALLALLTAAWLVAASAGAEERDPISVEAEPLADATGALRLRLTNHGDVPVRDVRVLIRHGFLWKDEYDPGETSPARAEVRAVEGTIGPGESRVIEHRPDPPLPARADGTFESRAELLGYLALP
jgi:hypothetical protein